MRVCLNALSRFVMEWLYQSQRRAGYVSPISESHLQTLFCGTPEKKSLGALSYVVQDEFVNKWKYWRFRSAQISLILYARETVIVKYFYFYFLFISFIDFVFQFLINYSWHFKIIYYELYFIFLFIKVQNFNNLTY